MSLKLVCLGVLSIIVYSSVPIQARVLRAEKLVESPSSGTQANASELPVSTTAKAVVADSTDLNRDEDANAKNAVASLDPAPGTIDGIEVTLDTVHDKKVEPKENQEEEKPSADRKKKEESKCNDAADKNVNESASSRDEAASIKVSAHESDDLAKQVPLDRALPAFNYPKASNLLLLSTPRLAREQEENISEPEDIDINTAVTTDETTELSIEIEAETESSESSEEGVKNAATDEPSFIMRISEAIFGKKPSGEKADGETSSAAVGQQDKEVIKKDDDVVIPAAAEQMPEPHSNNAGTAVLIEAESDYVLVDSDLEHLEHLEHLGSFTHADSDEHLQPIVHSVEVVPSHFEEPLLFTSGYVHAW